jgi:hypothetical protein
MRTMMVIKPPPKLTPLSLFFFQSPFQDRIRFYCGSAAKTDVRQDEGKPNKETGKQRRKQPMFLGYEEPMCRFMDIR